MARILDKPLRKGLQISRQIKKIVTMMISNMRVNLTDRISLETRVTKDLDLLRKLVKRKIETKRMLILLMSLIQHSKEIKNWKKNTSFMSWKISHSENSFTNKRSRMFSFKQILKLYREKWFKMIKKSRSCKTNHKIQKDNLRKRTLLMKNLLQSTLN